MIQMLTSSEREFYRQRAMIAWKDAKRLTAAAARLAAIEAEKCGQGERSVFRAATDHGFPGPASRRELEMLVERAIRHFTPEQEDEDAVGAGAGLLASADLVMLLRLSELVGRRLGYVVSAHDAGTALGLAIVTQPDIAIVDTRLELADGVDLTAALPLYSPRTKSLVLTDERCLLRQGTAGRADVLPRQFSEQELLSWVSEGAA
jgi:hypothetical protein